MGISPNDKNCPKHPNLKQIPGVCSSCLGEKLSKLTPSTQNFPDFSSAAIFHSSSPEFSPVPPPQPGGGHRRIGSAAMMGKMTGIGSLKKSRSVTCGGIMRRDCEEKEDEGEMIELDLSGSKKKKSGFWWRLIRSTSKKISSGIKQRHGLRDIGFGSHYMV
ncbi:hypothetical protein AKJ16_DCAP13982 [Drosera capensis]